MKDEIMAAIAAVIASMEQTQGYKVIVRSIRRVPVRSSVWNSTGRIERFERKL